MIKGYITENEAAQLMGVKPKTLRLYCTNEKRKRYCVKTAKASKTMVYYNEADLVQEIKNKIRL